MSKRNSREAKARRRAERAARRSSAHASADDLAQVHSFGDLAELAQRGEALPCGCDAHEALHDMLDFATGQIPPGYQTGPP